MERASVATLTPPQIKQREMLHPVHVGSKCSAAAEWLGHHPMLSRLLSRRCPFRCQHNVTDEWMPARRHNYCPTVPELSRRLFRRTIVFSVTRRIPPASTGTAVVLTKL